MNKKTSDKQRQPRPTPKFRRRADARPDEVLDAALELFTIKGFAATRVDEIAKRAGISKGALYLYFPSKESLLEELVRRAIVPIANDTINTAKNYQGDPKEIITIMLNMMAAGLGENKILDLPKLILREALVNPKIANMYKTEVIDKILPVFITIIENGIKNNYFRSLDAELSARSIVGPIIIHILLGDVFNVIPNNGLMLNHLINNHLSILFDGISIVKEEE